MLPQGTLPRETVSGVMDELKTSLQLNKVITIDRIIRLEQLMRQKTFELVAEILQLEGKIEDSGEKMIMDDQVMQELEQNQQHQLKIQKMVQEWNAMKQPTEAKQQALDNSQMEKSGDEVSTPQENPLLVVDHLRKPSIINQPFPHM